MEKERKIKIKRKLWVKRDIAIIYPFDKNLKGFNWDKEVTIIIKQKRVKNK